MQFSAMVFIDDLQGLFKQPIIWPLKFKMADLTCRPIWISQTHAEW